jgi:hypothetical protein
MRCSSGKERVDKRREEGRIQKKDEAKRVREWNVVLYSHCSMLGK